MDDILAEIGIMPWTYYGDSIGLGDILIGNGFSINLCDRLSYRSLFDLFQRGKSSELISLFKALNTNNFELVIEILNNTVAVNEIYGVDNSVYPRIIEELKIGLIQVINQTHPLYKEINPEIFRSLSVELSQFNHIFTTNYDIFLYRIILAYNELLELGRVEGQRYKDDFCDEIGEHVLRLKYFDEQCKKIYYLHGSLFIFNQNYTFKFRKGGETDEYIKQLNREVQNDNFPLFVAEGSPSDKYNAISNNYYLSNCLHKLKKRRGQFVVYGMSFQNSDKHIIDAINESDIEQIFISVYIGNKSKEDLEKEASRFRTMFKCQVYLYDSKTLFNFSPKYVF